jgi:hypothetical protein
LFKYLIVQYFKKFSAAFPYKQNGTAGFIRVEDITTSTNNTSLFYSIQDDHTISGGTSVPCMSGLFAALNKKIAREKSVGESRICERPNKLIKCEKNRKNR